jgi:plasmid stabilization system protein ParE
MHKVRLTPEAVRDLEELKQYISVELKNPIAAKKTLQTITRELRTLARFPESGPSIEALTGYRQSFVSLSAESFLRSTGSTRQRYLSQGLSIPGRIICVFSSGIRIGSRKTRSIESPHSVSYMRQSGPAIAGPLAAGAVRKFSPAA